MKASKTEEILKALQANNVAYTDDTFQVGIKTGRHVWHWFNKICNKEFLSFDHSYSMNTGASKRGYRHERSVVRSIEKRIGINI